MNLLIFFATLFTCLFGAKFSGTANLQKDDGFSFLGKFCFQYSDKNKTAGETIISLSNGNINNSNVYRIIFYDDQSSSWPYIDDHESDMSCTDKIKSNYAHIDELFLFNSNDGTYEITIPINQHIRPRWWWAFLVNCNYNNQSQSQSQSISTKIDYDIHFYQLDVTSWDKELGSNEKGMNTMYLFYLCVYFLLFGVQLYAYYVYRIQQYVHQIIKLLTTTIALQLFGILFHFVDWMIFTETGEHELFVQIIAGIFEYAGSSIFLLLLLVIAQGWTISRFEVSKPKLILISCLIVFIFQLSFYIWTLVGLDNISTVYTYNSIPEYSFSSLFALIGVIFVIICFKSWKNESLESKRTLYITIGSFYFIWFITPLLTIFIGDGFHAWERDIAIDAIVLTWTTIVYTVMIGLMWPKWAHQYFSLSMGDTQERILGNIDTISRISDIRNIKTTTTTTTTTTAKTTIASTDGNSNNNSSNKKNSNPSYKILEEDRL